MNMINAKELRIGNWGRYEKENFKIHSVSPELPCLDTIEFGVGVVTYENIYPIELTEDILIKCGFQEVNGYIYLTHDALNLATLQYDKEKRVVWLEFEGTICGNEIQNLHQLQNLYFALTGEELNVELKVQESDTTEAK